MENLCSATDGRSLRFSHLFSLRRGLVGSNGKVEDKPGAPRNEQAGEREGRGELSLIPG